MGRITTDRLPGLIERRLVSQFLIAGTVALGLGAVMPDTASPSTDRDVVAPPRPPIEMVMDGRGVSRQALSLHDPVAHPAEDSRRARDSPDLRDFLFDTAIQFRALEPEHPSRWRPHGVD